MTERLITDKMVNELVGLAEKYAKSANLIPREYLLGIFDGMTGDNLFPQVENLIRYHKEWLQKCHI